jgi:hypothetical protein
MFFKIRKAEIKQETKLEAVDIKVEVLNCESCEAGIYRGTSEHHNGLGRIYICDVCGERNYEENIKVKR